MTNTEIIAFCDALEAQARTDLTEHEILDKMRGIIADDEDVEVFETLAPMLLMIVRQFRRSRRAP